MAQNTNGLMKKTKSQLIEIILRKDSVEQECRTEISNLKEIIIKHESNIKNIDKSYNDYKEEVAKKLLDKENLIESMKSQFDDYATEIAELKEQRKYYKRYSIILCIVCVILAFSFLLW